MKILYVSSSNYWGGATVALLGIIKYLHKNEHDVAVFTVSKYGRLIDELKKESITCYISKWNYSLNIWPTCKNPIKFIIQVFANIYIKGKVQKEIENIISIIRPDIVHTNVGPLDFAYNACKKYHVTHVWHMREYQVKDFNMHFFPFQKIFRNKITTIGNYNIAITKDIFTYWQLRPDKDCVIYDGVFSEKILPVSQRKNKENFILFVGRIQPAKSPYQVLIAFNEYIKRFQDDGVLLKLVGSYSPYSSYYKKCCAFLKSHGISNRVEFLGERKDVYELMSKARCLIVSSRDEGFGFITVEAMLNFCPVIGRYTGGTKEQIENGLIYEKKPIALSYISTNELTDCIQHILNSNMCEMVNRAYDMVTTHYSIEICGKQIESFYNKIITK